MLKNPQHSFIGVYLLLSFRLSEGHTSSSKHSPSPPLSPPLPPHLLLLLTLTVKKKKDNLMLTWVKFSFNLDGFDSGSRKSNLQKRLTLRDWIYQTYICKRTDLMVNYSGGLRLVGAVGSTKCGGLLPKFSHLVPPRALRDLEPVFCSKLENIGC